MKRSLRYHSKIGFLWLFVIFVIASLNVLFFHKVIIDFSHWGTWLSIIFLVFIDGLFIDATCRTYYELNEDHLKVLCGCFFHEEIPYHDIISFRETHNPLSSAGLSLDRLDILYKAQKGRNGNSEVLISPMHKQEFIQELQKRSHRRLIVQTKKTMK